jgi:hypothetical protein
MHIRGLGYSGRMYFKEHPHQYSYVEMKVVGNLRCGNTRDRFYYSALKSMGCQFLGPTVSLTDKRCIVIAVSGTVALERAVLGLPTVVAGHVWYQDIGLISKLDNIHSLDQLMQVSSHSLPHPLINERLIALALEREVEINETENLTEDGGSDSYLELLNCLLNEPKLSLE